MFVPSLFPSSSFPRSWHVALSILSMHRSWWLGLRMSCRTSPRETRERARIYLCRRYASLTHTENGFVSTIRCITLPPPPIPMASLIIHNQVFVLTEKSEAKQKEYFNKVTKLALSRCGVKVDVSPWLVGRAALNEFLDNHRRVVDHIIRHRMALGMW